MDGEELLPERPRSALLRTAARRRALAIAAVLLLGAGLGTRFATAGHHTARPAPTGSPIAEPVQLARLDASLFPYDPTVCPSTVSCRASADLPAAVLTAVRATAPGAQPVRSRTVQVIAPRAALWFRQLDAATRDVQVQVVVKRAAPEPASAPEESSYRFHGSSIGFVRVNVESFAVSVRFSAAAAERPPMAAIRTLAADPRLLLLG